MCWCLLHVFNAAPADILEPQNLFASITHLNLLVLAEKHDLDYDFLEMCV